MKSIFFGVVPCQAESVTDICRQGGISSITTSCVAPEWTARAFETRQRRLSDVDLSDIEYDMKTGAGLVIVNWGTLLEGKLMLLLAGSPEYQDALLNELEYRL